jgi:hypothetical protein
MATKQYSYSGIYEKLKYLDEFNINKLKEIAKPSLDEIGFEYSPFRNHIICLQSILNTSRLREKSPKKVELFEDPEPKE